MKLKIALLSVLAVAQLHAASSIIPTWGSSFGSSASTLLMSGDCDLNLDCSKQVYVDAVKTSLEAYYVMGTTNDFLEQIFEDNAKYTKAERDQLAEEMMEWAINQ